MVGMQGHDDIDECSHDGLVYTCTNAPNEPSLQSVAVSYDDVISNVVRGVEAVGTTIMIVGGIVALAGFLRRAPDPALRPGSYQQLRRSLGRTILLGLEILIIGDIVRTIIVDPTIESVAVLGMIVLIRIVLSFSLEVEIDGTWPWSRWRVTGSGRAADS